MAGDKDYSRVRLPKGLKRATIISSDREKYHREFDYDKAIDNDFDEHRAEYREILMYGVPVKVKVSTE